MIHILVDDNTDNQCLINDSPFNPLKKMVGSYLKSIDHLNKKVNWKKNNKLYLYYIL